MVRRKEEMKVSRSKLKNGVGEAELIDILEMEDLHGTGRFFGITRMKPGVTNGVHTHVGDFETYYILKGTARVNDNGEFYELHPGDMVQCRDGEFHGLECIGDEDLEYLSVILYSR